jgi:hypothetical protein
VIEDLIPHVYDVERVVPLVGQDSKQRLETINKQVPQPDPLSEGMVRYVMDPDSAMSRGEYAVSVEAGPSYASKREETRATLVELFQAFPPAAQILGDKLVGVIDMPDAEDAADRLKAMLPPVIQQMEAAKQKGVKIDPQTAQQMMQMQQQMQQMQQMVQQLQDALQKAKAGEASKIAQAHIDGSVSLAKAEMDGEVKLAIAGMTAPPAFAAPGPQYPEYMGSPSGQGAIPGPTTPAPPPAYPQQPQQPQPMQQQPQQQMQPMIVQMPAASNGPDAATVIQGMQMIAETMKEALLAPRKMDVLEDADGNVVGGVSRVVQ